MEVEDGEDGDGGFKDWDLGEVVEVEGRLGKVEVEVGRGIEIWV